MAGTGPSVVVLVASGMPVESVSQISAPEWDVVSESALKRKLHPGTSAQTGTHFPDRPSSGSCVPDSGSRVGCRFRLRYLAEAVSWNRASEWDALSRQELKWKLRPGFGAQNGTRFPDGMFGGNYGPVFGSRTGYIFRNGPRAVVYRPFCVRRLSNYVIASYIIGRYNIASYNVKEGWSCVYRKNSGNVRAQSTV